MKKSLLTQYHVFISQKSNRVLLRLTLGLWILLATGIAFMWGRLPPQLPLYYSRPWGAEQIGTPPQLVIVYTILVCLCLFNTLCAIMSARLYPLFSRILFIGAVGITVLFTITIIKISFLIL